MPLRGDAHFTESVYDQKTAQASLRLKTKVWIPKKRQSILRKLERLNLDSEASDAQKPAPPISLTAGTRLVREWRGVTYTVLVHADGFEWNGRRYRSLTIVAREITGAHWSGPRFFGLRKRAGRSVESAEGEHAEA